MKQRRLLSGFNFGDAGLDLVAAGADGVNALACGVFQGPVKVLLAGKDRAGVAAVHGDDDVGNLDDLLGYGGPAGPPPPSSASAARPGAPPSKSAASCPDSSRRRKTPSAECQAARSINLVTEQPASALQRFVQDDDPSALTLIVDTPQGTHVRRIPPALPLPAHVDHGTGAETAAHTAAATWGMPDFVFQQQAHAAKGSGQRELGDRLLLAGRRRAVVQVRARTITPKPDALEAGWIQKVAAKAMSQAKGTVRQLRMMPADMVNGRGRVLRVDGDAYEWIAVFLLDHPQVPEDTVATWQPTGMPAIALTRRDWDFLFDQLCSTTAVLDYLFRAAGEPAIPLGEEPVRYYEFAAADAAATPKDLDTELLGSGGTLFSTPRLPQAPAGADGTNVHLMIRLVLEDIALSPLDDHLSEANRFTLLSDLDRLPVSARAQWGRLLLDMLADVPQVREEHSKWRFRRLLEEDGLHQLIVGAATRFDPVIKASFSVYVQLCHHEVTSRTGRAQESSTLGVLLTPRRDGRRTWDTSTVRVHGDLELSEEEVQNFSDVWNRAADDGTVSVDV